MAYTELEKKYARKERAFILKMKEYREVALEYLKDLLGKYQRILLNFGGDNPEEIAFVSYDGGSHPEYASNVFSEVSSVGLNAGGEVSLEIEEDDDYNVDRLETNEIYNLIYIINNSVLPNFRNREKAVIKHLQKKEFADGMDVSDYTNKADTIKYDKEAKAIRYYNGDEEANLQFSDKQEIISSAYQELDYSEGLEY